MLQTDYFIKKSIKNVRKKVIPSSPLPHAISISFFLILEHVHKISLPFPKGT